MVDLDEKGGREELKGVEIGEPEIRIYCMRTSTIFDKREK